MRSQARPFGLGCDQVLDIKHTATARHRTQSTSKDARELCKVCHTLGQLTSHTSQPTSAPDLTPLPTHEHPAPALRFANKKGPSSRSHVKSPGHVKAPRT